MIQRKALDRRKNLITFSGKDAFEVLDKLWNGKLQEEADLFYDRTGEDYEQCLVEYLIEQKYKLDPCGIQSVLKQFQDDKQFYELVHLLLVSSFDGDQKKLRDHQFNILTALCEDEIIWENDEALKEYLSIVALPTERKELYTYLQSMFT